MSHDLAVAQPLLPGLPRAGLTERLLADDPTLVELAQPLLTQAREVRAAAARRGIHTVAWHDPAFPGHLRTLSDMPPVLWYRGALDCLTAPGVAIVGARAASTAALEAARWLAAGVAMRGITVISGLARGVDSAAHRGALSTGRTAAVLGGDVGNVYPSEHDELADEITERGIVLSEYPPGTPALPYHFPLRNRIISGLARVVVVVEAAEKSGSLITAACALEQGREVMAVPGSVLNGRNRGGHALIRDGAKIVETADDILGELRGPGVVPLAALAASNVDLSSSSGRALLDALLPGEAYDVDALMRATGLDGPTVLRALTDLELSGLVRRTAGGICIRV